MDVVRAEAAAELAELADALAVALPASLEATASEADSTLLGLAASLLPKAELME